MSVMTPGAWVSNVVKWIKENEKLTETEVGSDPFGRLHEFDNGLPEGIGL